MKKTIPESSLMLVSYNTLMGMSKDKDINILQIEPDGLDYIIEVIFGGEK